MIPLATWKLLNPDYSIEEDKPLTSNFAYSMSPEEKERQILSLKEDGYCFLPSVIEEAKVESLRKCVENLTSKNIPPVYSFIYDPFWELILDLDPILTDILGKDYVVIPNVWTWEVTSQKPSFFRPHRDLEAEDFIDENGMPTFFVIWIPLTDVTTSHSCMHLLPASLDPDYPENALHWRAKWEKEGHPPWKADDLINIRALPAPKGSFLGWNGGVLHWGSRPHPKATPRISIGYLFQSAKAKKKLTPAINLKEPLSLAKRLEIIFNQMRIYGKSL